MEFEVAGNTYRSTKLEAKKQFHLGRRLAPVLANLKQANEADFFSAIAGSISEMSDENCDYILDTCMSVVKRKQGSAWANVFNERSKSLMFDDIDMANMLEIARVVIEENLGNFFGGKRASGESSPTPTT